MKRLYTSLSPVRQVSGFMPLHPIDGTASTMPWANASFAQQIPFSFSHQRSNIL
jgi:hypothetical protein